MGPHFFKCGNLKTEDSVGKHHLGFNGAALFQVRKFETTISAIVQESRASMGPHFFKCGNEEIARKKKEKRLASMGPHFFKCGNCISNFD